MEDEYCRHILEYNIALVDEAGNVVKEKNTGLNSCSNSKCSTLLVYAFSNQSYMLNISTISDGLQPSDAVTSKTFSE